MNEILHGKDETCLTISEMAGAVIIEQVRADERAETERYLSDLDKLGEDTIGD